MHRVLVALDHVEGRVAWVEAVARADGRTAGARIVEHGPALPGDPTVLAQMYGGSGVTLVALRAGGACVTGVAGVTLVALVALEGGQEVRLGAIVTGVQPGLVGGLARVTGVTL